MDLYYMPPEVTVLAKCRVKMEEFLDGETELDFVFTKEGDKESVVKTAKRDKDAKEEKEKVYTASCIYEVAENLMKRIITTVYTSS